MEVALGADIAMISQQFAATSRPGYTAPKRETVLQTPPVSLAIGRTRSQAKRALMHRKKSSLDDEVTPAHKVAVLDMLPAGTAREKRASVEAELSRAVREGTPSPPKAASAKMTWEEKKAAGRFNWSKVGEEWVAANLALVRPRQL